MNWLDWIAIGLLCFSAFVNVYTQVAPKPAKQVSPQARAAGTICVLVVQAFLIWRIVV